MACPHLPCLPLACVPVSRWAPVAQLTTPVSYSSPRPHGPISQVPVSGPDFPRVQGPVSTQWTRPPGMCPRTLRSPGATWVCSQWGHSHPPRCAPQDLGVIVKPPFPTVALVNLCPDPMNSSSFCPGQQPGQRSKAHLRVKPTAQWCSTPGLSPVPINTQRHTQPREKLMSEFPETALILH